MLPLNWFLFDIFKWITYHLSLLKWRSLSWGCICKNVINYYVESMKKPWRFYRKGIFVWKPVWDKKLYPDFFKREGVVISTPPFWVWNCASNKTTLPNVAFNFNLIFLILHGLDYHCNFITTSASLFLHSCNFGQHLNKLVQTYIHVWNQKYET